MRWWTTVVILATLACGRREAERAPERAPPAPDAVARTEDPWAKPRARMVDEQIAARGIADARVLDAMRRVPRHELMPAEVRDQAYEDHPVPIGFDQTISQPYIVAVMTEAAKVEPGDRVLEVGTGSGYQAAVLAELGADVYSIEIVEPLAQRTAVDLERIGYGRIHLRTGDGYRGWPDAAPFDAVIVTAAPPEVPAPLIEQLAVGGRLVIPVGEDGGVQELRVITRTADGSTTETLFPVRFVPMTGEAQREAR
jgi:protein-L-isoaspartate(D-aspartate) O-methyltransferase